MEAIEAIIVNFTSFAARKAFGNVNDAGHKNIAQPQCIHINICANSHVSSDKWYIAKSNGNTKIIRALIEDVKAYDIYINFLV